MLFRSRKEDNLFVALVTEHYVEKARHFWKQIRLIYIILHILFILKTNMKITHLSPNFATSSQITTDDVSELARLGFKTVVNNRSDQEDTVQPLGADIESAAKKAGMHYIALPVVSGNLSKDDAAKFLEILNSSPVPIVAFCRSGMRSTKLYEIARKRHSKL